MFLLFMASPKITVPVSAPFFAPLSVGIWSSTCLSFNITITNPNCPSQLNTIGNTISVQINVTNAPVLPEPGSFNQFSIYLYYDPTILNWTSIDFTNTIWGSHTMSTFAAKASPQGTLYIDAACLGCTNPQSNGPMVNVNFKVQGVGVSPLTLAAGVAPASNVSTSSTQLFVFYADATVHSYGPDTYDGYFMNQQIHRGPVAKFTYSPSSPKQAQVITFNATGSYDPDAAANAVNNGISQYVWDFGDGFATQTSAAIYPYKYLGQGVSSGSFTGNFSVLLTVVDRDDNFQGMQGQRLYIKPNPFHDLIAQSIAPSPSQVFPGDKVNVNVVVFNNGTFPESYNLSVTYGPPTTVFGSQSRLNITIGDVKSVSFPLDTSGLAPGFYTITANIAVLPSASNPMGIENLPRNNVATSVLEIRDRSQSSSSPLLIIAGVAATVVALGVLGVFLRRRRRRLATP